eukprot:753626-Hanusia_phi.AAC.4
MVSGLTLDVAKVVEWQGKYSESERYAVQSLDLQRLAPPSTEENPDCCLVTIPENSKVANKH